MSFTPLRISTIKPLKNITFDLYINFKEQFIRYKEKGIALEQEHLKKLRKQKIARFFIHANEEASYQKFLDEVLQETINSDDTPTEEKINIAEDAAGTAVEQMQENPGSKVAYKMTETAATNLIQIMSMNPDALQAIYDKEVNESDRIVKHSLNVCAMCIKVAEKLELSDVEIENIAAAALLHDIGLIKVPNYAELFKKRKSDYSLEEKKEYDKHGQIAADLLKDKPYINKEIIELIFNHEETLSGSGPNKKSKLTQSEEIISLVDSYDRRVTAQKIPAKEALKEVQVDELGNYGLDLINIFKKVLKEEKII